MVREQQTKSGECFRFLWRGPRGKGPGFRWELHSEGRWLLLGPPDDQLVPYEPLEEAPGLFLTFAHLRPHKESLLGFANEYGRLGTYQYYHREEGEPLTEWQQHHRWMQFLVALKRQCKEDCPQLAEHVHWDGGEVVFSFPKIGTARTETWRHRGELRRRLLSRTGSPLFQPGDLVGPARWFLGFAIDDWFGELQNWGKPIAPRMVWSETDHRPQLVVGPSSLLGAMVVQFAAALHGVRPFQECAYCHRFFPLQPGVNRANRRTCSPTCKQYLYNYRVARARQLHAAGWSVCHIIKELQVKAHGQKSSTDIVQGWIGRTSLQ